MPDTPPDSPKGTRRKWVAPTLTRHDSLSAMTQQYYPQQYPPGHPGNMQFGTYADTTIPGSAGVFI